MKKITCKWVLSSWESICLFQKNRSNYLEHFRNPSSRHIFRAGWWELQLLNLTRDPIYMHYKGEFAPPGEQRVTVGFLEADSPGPEQPCFWGDGGSLLVCSLPPAPGDRGQCPWRIRSPIIYLASSMACCFLNVCNNHAFGKVRYWRSNRRIWRGFQNNRITDILWHLCA